ncbi:MAG TPA: outer membrane lipoprotein-sorting protein [Candidatus Acidoferrales bacterium]|nr:outer membrane lipoprotein-sorting protein [Candidatus Acidoferrales bacterium]
MFRKSIWLLIFAAILARASVLAAQPQAHSAWTVDSVLSELDDESSNFESLTADIERTKVTVVVNVKSTESGSIFVRGDKMRLDLKDPSPRTILRTGDTIFVYTPGLNRVEEYNLGKHRELVDQFLLLGFGTSGHELKKGFLVTLLGERTLDQKKTILLELTPKSKEVRNQISKIHLWLDESSWLPVQQEFFETGTEDYFTIHYTNEVRNANIPNSRFQPRWPKGVQRVKPEG